MGRVGGKKGQILYYQIWMSYLIFVIVILHTKVLESGQNRLRVKTAQIVHMLRHYPHHTHTHTRCGEILDLSKTVDFFVWRNLHISPFVIFVTNIRYNGCFNWYNFGRAKLKGPKAPKTSGLHYVQTMEMKVYEMEILMVAAAGLSGSITQVWALSYVCAGLFGCCSLRRSGDA